MIIRTVNKIKDSNKKILCTINIRSWYWDYKIKKKITGCGFQYGPPTEPK